MEFRIKEIRESKGMTQTEAADVWPIMDELMSTLQVLQPRLYDGVMRKLQD